MPGVALALHEREEICRALTEDPAAGWAAIARRVGRHRTTVAREVARGGGLERHGGRPPAGVIARVSQRLLALTAVIWHNQTTQQPGPTRSLLAYDH